MKGTNDSINFLIARIEEIRSSFYKLDNLLLSTMSNEQLLLLPELSARDLATLKHIVRSGTIAAAEYRPPFGYRLLGFLVALRERQQIARLMEYERKDAELLELMVDAWVRIIQAEGGNLEKAKQRFRQMWGNSPVSDQFVRLFNQSYQQAKQLCNTSRLQ